MLRFFKLSMVLALSAQTAFAQQVPEPDQAQQKQPLTEEEVREQFTRSMTYMLRRAKLTRTLAAEHLLYLSSNGEIPEMHLVEEASQVIAFDLVCSDAILKPDMLDEIATSSSYRIAAQVGTSPIAPKLADLAREQTVQERMDLLGDVSTTVFMFQVGRRRGLFDSLITDFGEQRFCDGMRANMRERYYLLTDGAGQPEK